MGREKPPERLQMERVGVDQGTVEIHQQSEIMRHRRLPASAALRDEPPVSLLAQVA
ncbi:hypothetical protein GCM10011322_28530 [Salinarimonas ramus]|uniref:Uncharacterized protein n=1 Tax=Salinarimonas ramus TaxID=690164 RepID=A0A917QAI7_9HYPH|nr:hypothetical protein GCM10011322_28530 [Salinarimonas ramus]